jgi:hypothetical protein
MTPPLRDGAITSAVSQGMDTFRITSSCIVALTAPCGRGSIPCIDTNVDAARVDARAT